MPEQTVSGKSSSYVADLVNMVAFVAFTMTLVEAERVARVLERFPFIRALYDDLSREIYVLRLDEEQLLEARGILVDEPYKPREVPPPVAPDAPSRLIARQGNAFAQAIKAATQ